MTEVIDGHMGFLRSDVGTGASSIRLLGVIQGTTNQAPEVEISRVIASAPGTTELDPLDVKHGTINLKQLNSDGTTGQTSAGKLLLRLSGTPDQKGSSFVWEFSVSVSPAMFVPKGKSLDLVLRAHFSESEPLVELARLSGSSLLPLLNSGSPNVVTLLSNVVPRLSVGMNLATPKPAPSDQYKPQNGTTLARPAGNATQPGSGDSKDLASALYEVFVGLDDPKTFDPLWDSQTGDRTVFNLSATIVSRDPIRTADELWARQVTEMLAFTPYGGPSGTYGVSPESQFISEGLANGRYSVTFACQQLASFALASRGVTFSKLLSKKGTPIGELMLNAGSTTANTFTSKMSPTGQWFIFNNEAPQEVIKPSGAASQLGGSTPSPPRTANAFFGAGTGVAPGSVFLFANRPPKPENKDNFAAGAGCIITDLGKGNVEFCTQTDKAGTITPVISKINSTGANLVDNTANAHVAFVLRTDPNLKVFQTFDTGGLGVPGRGTGVSVFPVGSGFHSGNFDDPAGLTINGGDPFRGMGVLPALTTASAGTLQTRVETVLRAAMPLGFARIVLISRGAKPSNQEFKPGNARQIILTNRLIYASPVLRMNSAGANQNYAISRYVWSLRSFSAQSTVEAWWFLYIPIGELATATLASARTDSVRTIAQAAFDSMKADRKQLFTTPQQSAALTQDTVLRRLLTPLLDCTVTSSGSALITATLRSPQNLHALHTLENQAVATPTLPNLPRISAFLPSGVANTALPQYFQA